MDESYCINLCSNLGSLLDDSVDGRQRKRFVKNEGKCLRSLKRIRKELNADTLDEKNTALLLFGDVSLLQGYLIPLAIDYGQKDEGLLLEVTKIAVQLTMPLGVGDTIHVGRRLRQLQLIKAAFLRDGALHAFVSLVERPISVERSRRTDQDRMTIELLLWLLRNLLMIPDAEVGSTPGATKDAHLQCLHDNFLIMLHNEEIIDLVTFLAEYANCEENSSFDLILLEIFYHIFRTTRVSDIFLNEGSDNLDNTSGATLGRNVADTSNDSLAVLRKKSLAKRAIAAKASSSRHGRFAGFLCLENKTMGGSVDDSDGLDGKPSNAGQRTVVHNAFAAQQAMAGSAADEMYTKSVATGRRAFAPRSSATAEERSLEQHERSQKLHEMQLLGFIHSRSSMASNRRLLNLQKKLAAHLIDRCYKPLFSSLKKNFSRSDLRLLNTDHVQFMSLAGFCIEFERARVLSTREGLSFRWDKSPVMKTLDAWTFFYVIRACEMNLEDKKHRELEIAAHTMTQMVLFVLDMLQSKDMEVVRFVESLRNRVFHDIHQVELFPQMIRQWNEGAHSFGYLSNLALLSHTMVRILERMAQDSVLVSARSRKGKSEYGSEARGKLKNSKKTKNEKPWTSEETSALVEAARSGPPEDMGKPKCFRRALKDPALSAVFDPSRTVVSMAQRWTSILAKMKESDETDIEVFLRSEIKNADAQAEFDEGGSDVDSNCDNPKAKAEVHRERVLESRAVFRPYLNISVMKNLCVLVDPTKVPTSFPSSSLFQLHEEVLPKFFERMETECTGSLWSLLIFGIFTRSLETYSDSSRPNLNRVLRRIVRTFFDHARDNPFAFIELLCIRNKKETELMLNDYESRDIRRTRLYEEELKREKEETENIYRQRMQDENDEGVGSIKTTDSLAEVENEKPFNSSFKRREIEFDDEIEADL